MMTRKSFLFALSLIGFVVSLVRGQYSPQPFEIPPHRVIEEYKRQLEDDVYAVERKAEILAQRQCITGQEDFLFCPLELSLFDFIRCIGNPALTQGSDAFSRGIKFPSSAFASAPVVALGISGIGTITFGDVQVVSKDVTPSGFILVISGGVAGFFYSVTVSWIACPAKSLLTPSVREYIPKLGPPAPPYFPINYFASPAGSGKKPSSKNQIESTASGLNELSYNQDQPRYDDRDSGYEESSRSIDEIPSSYEQPSPYTPNPSSYEESPSTYTQRPPRYEESPPTYAQSPPSNGQSQSSYAANPRSYSQRSSQPALGQPGNEQSSSQYASPSAFYEQPTPRYPPDSPAYG